MITYYFMYIDILCEMTHYSLHMITISILCYQSGEVHI